MWFGGDIWGDFRGAAQSWRDADPLHWPDRRSGYLSQHLPHLDFTLALFKSNPWFLLPFSCFFVPETPDGLRLVLPGASKSEASGDQPPPPGQIPHLGTCPEPLQSLHTFSRNSQIFAFLPKTRSNAPSPPPTPSYSFILQFSIIKSGILDDLTRSRHTCTHLGVGEPGASELQQSCPCQGSPVAR